MEKIKVITFFLLVILVVYLRGKYDDLRKLRSGWVFNPNGWWLGVHYSSYNKRYCINVIPCITIWVVKPGGKIPKRNGKSSPE